MNKWILLMALGVRGQSNNSGLVPFVELADTAVL